MSRDEVIDHLGTIAKSGTAQFMQKLSGDQKKDAQLIGQFGVGFYSAFIVADRVVVTTRRAGAPTNEGVSWDCSGDAEFSVETIEKASRGTTVELHLKDDALEFADHWRLRSIIKKYSDHIAIPVLMEKQTPAGEDAPLPDRRAPVRVPSGAPGQLHEGGKAAAGQACVDSRDRPDSG